MTATKRVNTYFAMLLVTICGAAATLLIVHIANADTYSIVSTDEAQYADLSQ
ncbi:MAG TPA: hypothetical protein VM103_02130 [Candidatus Paceibacterota bacterium]|nr:hypothetical protein [Candidatus Paceibacterota bacterium]